MLNLPVICRYKSFWRGIFSGVVLSSILWLYLILTMLHLKWEVVVEQAKQPTQVQKDDWDGRIWYEKEWIDKAIIK